MYGPGAAWTMWPLAAHLGWRVASHPRVDKRISPPTANKGVTSHCALLHKARPRRIARCSATLSTSVIQGAAADAMEGLFGGR